MFMTFKAQRLGGSFSFINLSFFNRLSLSRSLLQPSLQLLFGFGLFTAILTTEASAAPRSFGRTFTEELSDFADRQLNQYKNSWPMLVMNSSVILSDNALNELHSPETHQLPSLEKAADQIVDVLVKTQGKFAVVVGPPGIGKSSAIQLATRKIVAMDYPPTEAFYRSFENAAVIQVSTRRFLPGGYDLAPFLNTIDFIRTHLKRPIVLVLTETQFLNAYIVSCIREQADSPQPVPIILEVDDKTNSTVLSEHLGFATLNSMIRIEAPTDAEMKRLFKESVRSQIKMDYGVDLFGGISDALIESSADVYRQIADPRRTLRLAEEFAIDWLRANKPGANPKPIDVYRFAAKRTRLPVVPQNTEEFAKYMDQLKDKLKTKVEDQDPLINGLVDQFQSAMQSKSRPHSVAMVMGPTGVGKTFVAELIAQEFFGSKERLLSIDMTQFGDGHAVNTLFGASNGYISSDKEKGTICEFLDGPGSGASVIVLNEIEKAHSDVFTRLMELMDKGEVRCGDGKIRYLGRSLVVMTSNRNTNRILSYDSIRNLSPAELKHRLGQITQDQLRSAFSDKEAYTEDDSKVVKKEVLARIDRFYFASPLLKSSAVRIAAKEVQKLVDDYRSRMGLHLHVDPSFAEILTEVAYDETVGGRQLRNMIPMLISQAVSQFQKAFGFKAKSLKIQAQTHPSNKTKSSVIVTDPESGNSVEIDGPVIPVKNRLLDPAFREKLIALPSALNSQIHGQQEVIEQITAAIRNRYLDPSNGQVVSGFMMGATGSGKTQLAKVLAEHLFGRKTALGLFDMGQVVKPEDLTNIFSPKKGFIGSDTPGELEQFLINNPLGGVLLFDEMGNAGGGDKALKAAISKQFYTLLNEGIYRSPSGKVYDLTPYIVIMTSNDGEDRFRGYSSDSLLDETYKELIKDPGLARGILRESGFTDAFVARLSFAALMRPTLGQTKETIAEKLIMQWKARVEKDQPFDLTFSKDFAAQIGRLMFSPQTGARSIEQFISISLGQAVADLALRFDWDEFAKTGQRGQIELSLHIDQATLPFFEEKPHANTARLEARGTLAGNEFGLSRVDFTRSAQFLPQVHIESARATAYHEMGHALTTFSELTGKEVVKITIVPERIDTSSALGYVQYRYGPSKEKMNWSVMVAEIANLLGGSEAEKIFTGHYTVGRKSDLDRAGLLARRFILDGHLVPELDAANAYIGRNGEVLANLPNDLRIKFDRYVNKAIDEGRKLAHDELKTNWPLVEAGVQLLMKQGTVSEKEFEDLVKANPTAGAKADRSMPLWKKALRRIGLGGQKSTQPVPPETKPADCEKELTSGSDKNQGASSDKAS